MEEILASIRSIIADDKEPSPASVPAPKPSASVGPQIVYSNDSLPSVRAIAPAAEAASAPPPERPAEVAASSPKIAWDKPAAVAPEFEQIAPPAEEEEPFVSEVTDAAVSASFNALSASVALQSSAMVESLTREVLRPMLKTWLDDNLPSLVERLVRAEIQRVARGGR
jgi:uncharacterized protein